MASDWNPEQYHRFRDERAQPFFDLADGLAACDGPRVLDLGCGSGALTAELHQRLGARETVGIDASRAMLEKARALDRPGLSFQHGDLRAVQIQRHEPSETEATWPPDVIFSNAALHWADDHPRLLRHYFELLAPGGQLAVQVPANHTHASHRIADHVAAEPPFAEALAQYQRGQTVLEPEAYAELLYGVGFERRRVELRIYEHLLPETAAVIEWVKGSLLLDFQRRLDETLWHQFLARYTERLLAVLPQQQPYLYTYRRILFWGTKPRNP